MVTTAAPGQRRGADPQPGVVVHPEQVQRRRDRRRVAGALEVEAGDGGQVLPDVVRIAAAQHRIEEQPVVQSVHPPRGIEDGGMGVGRGDRIEVQRDPDLVRAPAAQRLDGEPVAEEQVVRGGHGGGRLVPTRGVLPARVAEERRAPGLVHRRPEADTVAQRGGREVGVLGEPLRRLAHRPATRLLQLVGQVPVVERHPGLDALGEELVDEPPVEVEARAGSPARSAGLHPRPGHREAVGPQPQLRHERDVLPPPVVVVGRDVAGVAVAHPARGGAEGVPDRPPATVLAGGALDLERRRGGTPQEVGREGGRVGHGAGRGMPVATDAGQESGHPLTTPSMMPPMIWRPNRTKTTTSGSVPSSVPAITSAWSV